MTTPSTPTEPRLLDRRTAVPLLLSSFPAPPSFIPPTPVASMFPQPPPTPSSPNPPLSLPPRAPLPPVPGPSPISETDTLKFISAARTRRASRMSISSLSPSASGHAPPASASGHAQAQGSVRGRRDSTASFASFASSAPLSPVMSLLLDPNAPALRSFPFASPSSYPVSPSSYPMSPASFTLSPAPSSSRLMLEHSPAGIPYIYEEDSDFSPAPVFNANRDRADADRDLTHISIPELSPMPSAAASSAGLSDTDADEDVLELGVGASMARTVSWKARQVARSAQSRMKHDSIASIELRDLPALLEDELALTLGPKTPASRTSSIRTSPSNSQPPRRTPSQLHAAYPHLRPNAAHHWTRPATAVLNKDLPPLPLQDADADEDADAYSNVDEEEHGEEHEDGEPEPSPTYSDFPSPPTPTPVPSAPAPTSTPTVRNGAASPDIAAILASTPRHKHSHHDPHRSSSGSHSTRRSRSTRSRSTKRGSRGSGSAVPLHPSLSNPSHSHSRRRSPHAHQNPHSHSNSTSDEEDEEDEEYGEVVDKTGTVMDWRMLDKEVEARLERELDGFGSDNESGGEEGESGNGSDSSIDVQTPLP